MTLETEKNIELLKAAFYGADRVLIGAGAGLSAAPLTHQEVFDAGQRMEKDMTALLRAAIGELDRV